MKAMGAGRSDDEIDALLSEGRLSGAVKDRIFDGALRDAGAKPVESSGGLAWRRRLGVAGLTLAAAAAVIALVPQLGRHGDDHAFRAKGGGAALDLDVACVAAGTASLAACPRGAMLVFSIRGARADGGYLAAYAEPRAGGERVWYFSADGETPPLPAASADQATRPLEKAIVIGPEHSPGEYRLMLFVTRVPLAKAALLAGPQGADVVSAREATLRIVAQPPRGTP